MDSTPSMSHLTHRFGYMFVILLLLSLSMVPILGFDDVSAEDDLSSHHLTAVNTTLQNIECVAGYTPTVYATGLSAPDGLAFGPDNLLYVVEESANRVSQLSATGMTATTIITGLDSPEGVIFDGVGSLYVTEDVKGGRVIKKPSAGPTETLATGLDFPESIVWVDDGSTNGTFYVTESNLEEAIENQSQKLDDYQTHITNISAAGSINRIFTKSPVITPTTDPAQALFWSYAGITTGSDGKVYFSNELSGQTVTGTISVFNQVVSYTATSGESIFSLDPATSDTVDPLADGLVVPEGLRFATGAEFPLYVAEEDAGTGSGRLSRVEADGSATALCTGFANIEDVAVGPDKRLYISEDTTGRIIAVELPAELPDENRWFIWLPVILRS